MGILSQSGVPIYPTPSLQITGGGSVSPPASCTGLPDAHLCTPPGTRIIPMVHLETKHVRTHTQVHTCSPGHTHIRTPLTLTHAPCTYPQQKPPSLLVRSPPTSGCCSSDRWWSKRKPWVVPCFLGHLGWGGSSLWSLRPAVDTVVAEFLSGPHWGSPRTRALGENWKGVGQSRTTGHHRAGQALERREAGWASLHLHPSLSTSPGAAL